MMAVVEKSVDERWKESKESRKVVIVASCGLEREQWF